MQEYMCDECHKDESHSKYSNPVILNIDNQKNKLIHVECCSDITSVNRLKQIASTEYMFYKDLSNLINNFDPQKNDNIKFEEFLEKYGTYNEYQFGIKIDRFIEVLAILDKLNGI